MSKSLADCYSRLLLVSNISRIAWLSTSGKMEHFVNMIFLSNYFFKESLMQYFQQTRLDSVCERVYKSKSNKLIKEKWTASVPLESLHGNKNPRVLCTKKSKKLQLQRRMTANFIYI